MFWVVWPDIKISETFAFDYVADEWSMDYIHTFLNGENYDGVMLVPKRAEINHREIAHSRGSQAAQEGAAGRAVPLLVRLRRGRAPDEGQSI